MLLAGPDRGATPRSSTIQSSHLGEYGAELGSTDCERAWLYLGELPPLSVQHVQLQMTIVLQWRWLRKQSELLKLNSLRLAT